MFRRNVALADGILYVLEEEVGASLYRDDLSHFDRGMRLPTPPEHIKFHWRQQDLCKNVLLARVVRGGYASIGGGVSFF